MRARYLIGGAAVLAVAAAAGLAVGLPKLSGGEQAAAAGPAETATVTRQTLSDTETKSGTLGYGAEYTVGARSSGTVTWLAGENAVIGRGKPLFRIDDQPVLLLYGALPAYRQLRSGVEGTDVKQLEQNLQALGYDGFTVDREFTASTASAVREWQEDLGLAETGMVEPGRIVFASGPVRVDALSASVGDLVQPGTPVLTRSGVDRAVVVELEVADERLAEVGAAVEVELPDGKRVPGKVGAVQTVIAPGVNGADPTTNLEVTVSLAAKAAVQGFHQAAVDVDFTAETREGVLTVPVAALLALAEGGYGVEVVEGGTSRIVAVQTGLFAAGRVEVSGDGLAEGTVVGMPS
ncbi:efflux RND transporter periplasmic adaptor subunit [Catellatospora chokoriensis]|uniref:Peptidoglycan-binding protein n=1 Tax=Catellatospora chokoriensis TaxID=310353 RepID=A0A8J3JUK8_9ACTN|nr:peptidoglycan-binding protein [Catellatospora chokoriensis]GIF88784.1 peptidoglycan-binding protein [Catellatospora chokoriensis]